MTDLANPAAAAADQGSAPPAEPAAGNPLGRFLQNVFVSGIVSMLALTVYDTQVRLPQTPRLAMVDIAKLFAEAEARAKDGVLAAVGKGVSDEARRSGDIEAAQAATQFGPRVEAVLRELADECQCAIVVMAAVVGKSNGLRDYTQEAAIRLGLAVRTEVRP